MSITISDIMKLPCMQGAEVVAGAQGLSKFVTSVTVLEYSEPTPLQEELFLHNDFIGSELVITGLTAIKDDVAAQCAIVRRYSMAGEVGMLLYYVGIFLPEIAPELITLCNELDFPLICMPRNRINLRYSEAICEIMEAIFHDQATQTYFVGDLIERISLLPAHQRSMDTLLKMLGDQLRASVFLADASHHILNAATWPRVLELDLAALLRQLPLAAADMTAYPVVQNGKQRWIGRCTVNDSAATPMFLYLVKDGDICKPDTLRQVGEVVQLFINIWSQNHGELAISELARAILQDEPLKMRRLAALLHIDVQSLHAMWLIHPQPNQTAHLPRALEQCRDFLKSYCATVVADLYEDSIIIFMDMPYHSEINGTASALLYSHLSQENLDFTLVRCNYLPTTTSVRHAYLDILAYLDTAAAIYSDRRLLTLQEILFAKNCREILSRGEEAVADYLEVLAPLGDEDDTGRRDSLLQTLTVYLLDTQLNMSATAEKLFLHKNTIKYRIQSISEKVGFRVEHMPEMISLYYATALQRLLSANDLSKYTNINL